jgi:hypothetical protein
MWRFTAYLLQPCICPIRHMDQKYAETEGIRTVLARFARLTLWRTRLARHKSLNLTQARNTKLSMWRDALPRAGVVPKRDIDDEILWAI